MEEDIPNHVETSYLRVEGYQGEWHPLKDQGKGNCEEEFCEENQEMGSIPNVNK